MKKTILTAFAVTSVFLGAGVSWGDTPYTIYYPGTSGTNGTSQNQASAGNDGSAANVNGQTAPGGTVGGNGTPGFVGNLVSINGLALGYTSLNVTTNGGDGGFGGAGGIGGTGGHGYSADYGYIVAGGNGGNGGTGGGGGVGANGGTGGAILVDLPSNLTLTGITFETQGGVGGDGGVGGAGGYRGSAGINYFGIDYSGNNGNGGNGGNGGNAGSGGDGGTISLTTSGIVSGTGVNVQSTGGAGGNGGDAGAGGVGSTNGTAGNGGNGGNGGSGGTITLVNTGSISTSADDINGIYASSEGGNGGDGGTGTVVGAGGAGGASQTITVTNAGAINTSGQGSYGISVETYGGNGGETGAGILSGAGGNAGDITIVNTGSIVTSGLYGDGIDAYTVGGYGTTSGNGGNISITNSGTILNIGEETYGIYAYSYANSGSLAGGTAGNISIDISGAVKTTGTYSTAIYLNSQSPDHKVGALSVNVSGLVYGGYNGTAIDFVNGSQSTLTIAKTGVVTTADGVNGVSVVSTLRNDASDVINNSGLLVGSVNLLGGSSVGSGENTINNSGVFYSGTSILLGAGNSLYNSGLFLVGGPSTVLTTSITGNYIESSTGISGVKIGGTSQGLTYDYAVVSGTAYVDGTLRTYQLNKFVPNPVNARWGLTPDTFTVLSANTLLIPDTATLDDYFVKNYLVKLTTYRNTNDLILVTKQSTFDTLFNGYHDGLSSNQRAVAKALDKAIVKSDWNGGTDGRADKLIERLDNIDKSHLRGALDEIAPEELGLLVDAGLGVVNAHQLTILGRLDQTRLPGLLDPAPVASKDGKDGKAIASASRVQDNNGLYAVGNFSGFKMDDQDNIKGGRDQSYGGTFGYDRRISDSLLLGVAGSYFYNDLKFSQGRKTDVNSGLGSLYASYLSGNFHLDGILGGGAGSYDVTRKGLDGKNVSGDTDSAEIHGLLGAGYDIPVKGFTFTPKASIAYTNLWMNGFTESGSLAPLKINDFNNTSSLKTRVGSTVNYNATVCRTLVTPEIGLYWQHEFMDPQRSVGARLSSGAGGSFTVDSASSSRDSLVPTVAVNVKLTSNVDLRLAGEAELFNNANSYNSEASVSISW